MILLVRPHQLVAPRNKLQVQNGIGDAAEKKKDLGVEDKPRVRADSSGQQA
jgi:hypothetical protein